MNAMATIERASGLSEEQLATLDKVLSDIEKYGSLRKACELNAIGTTSVLRWIETSPLLEERYARARQYGYDNLAETALYDATEATDVSKAGLIRIAFDARKWYLSKLASDKYGDKTRTELTGKDGAAIAIDTTARDPIVSELAALLRQAKRPGAVTIEGTATPRVEAPRIDDISDLI